MLLIATLKMWKLELNYLLNVRYVGFQIIGRIKASVAFVVDWRGLQHAKSRTWQIELPAENGLSKKVFTGLS